MKVAVINSNPDLVQILSDVLTAEGHTVATAHVRAWKEDLSRIGSFFRVERPEVAIFDIAIPYDQDWAFFQKVVRANPDARDTRFVVTTTNLHALRALVGDVDVIEVVGKPYDLARILKAVNYASSSPPSSGKPAS